VQRDPDFADLLAALRGLLLREREEQTTFKEMEEKGKGGGEGNNLMTSVKNPLKYALVKPPYSSASATITLRLLFSGSRSCYPVFPIL